MKTRVFTAASVCIALFAVVAHALDLPQPESQAIRPTTLTESSPASSSFHIYVDLASPATFEFIAGRAAIWLGTQTEIRDLSELGQYPNDNQIVIGDPASLPIHDLAIAHGLSTLDVGTEGYEMDSRTAPSGPAIWRVLIVATNVAGARNGVMALLDTKSGTSFRKMRVRDYPDSRQRGFYYMSKAVGFGAPNAATWVEQRKSDIDEIAQRGVNTIYFQTSDWYHLEEVVQGQQRGLWLKQLFDYCRNLGIEPAPLITLTEPAAAPFNTPNYYARFREGKQVEREEFYATQGQPLVNVKGPFPNGLYNVDWSQQTTCNGLPCQWVQDPPGGPWTWQGGKLVVPSTYPGGMTHDDFVYDEVPIVPGSYYVLRVTFTHIEFTSSPCTPNERCRPEIRVANTNSSQGPIMYYPLAAFTADGQHPTVVYECPIVPNTEYLDGQDTVRIGVSTNGATDPFIEISEVRLYRRSSGFKNLMEEAPYTFVDQGQSTSDEGLPLKVMNETGGQYARGVEGQPNTDYWVETPAGLSWEMSQGGPESIIHWQGPTPPGGKVWVTSTLGVPAAHPGHSYTNTTWCFSNGRLLNEYRRMFRDLFTATGYGLNPKYIHVDMGETRGVNRCGRCVEKYACTGSGSSMDCGNKNYFRDYLNTLQGILGGISGAEQTRIVVLADMISPYQNGANADYQYRQWCGRMGASKIVNSEITQALPTGLDSDIILHMWATPYANAALNAQWPAGHSFMAGPYLPSPGDNAEEWTTNTGWYGPNGLGFTVMQWEPSYNLPTAVESRMLDYAWKRNRYPDASLHAFIGTDFKTDETADHLVNVPLHGTLTVFPYGRKGRSPCTGVVSSAVLNWGEGSAISLTPSQLNNGSFTHTYNTGGNRTVLLMVFTTGCTTPNCPCNGNAYSSASIHVSVPTKNGCEPDCPEPEGLTAGSPPVDADLSAAIRGIQPNPFGSSVVVHFTVPKPTKPEMEVFDVRGRKVAGAKLHEHAPGAWTWTWDGTDGKGHSVDAGVYFVRARLGDRTEIRRLVKLEQ